MADIWRVEAMSRDRFEAMVKLCECGCGQPTAPARDTDARRGWVRGQPVRFLNHHNKRLERKTIQAVLDKLEPVTESGCWLWTGSIRYDGYGSVKWHGRTEFVHRVVYMQMIGPIPKELEVDHLCRVRCCANPQHLELVTPSLNIRRSRAAKKASKV